MSLNVLKVVCKLAEKYRTVQCSGLRAGEIVTSVSWQSGLAHSELEC